MGRAVYGGAECGPARSGAAVAVCTQLVDSWPGPAPQYPAASRHTNTYTPAKQISTLSHSFRTVPHSSAMQTAAPGPGEAKHMPVFGLGRDTSGRDDNHNERLYGGRESKDSSIAALEAFQRDYLPSLVAGFPAPAPASQRLPAPPPPPRQASPPSCSPPLVQVGAESLHTSHTFDEQFKDVSFLTFSVRPRVDIQCCVAVI